MRSGKVEDRSRSQEVGKGAVEKESKEPEIKIERSRGFGIEM